MTALKRREPLRAFCVSYDGPFASGDAMSPEEPDLTRNRPRHGDTQFWDRQLRAQIGRDLRALFENSMQEPLPERITRMIEEMDRQSTSGSQNEGSSSNAPAKAASA
ncbi:MAG TPA: NepR family anti-sigma factor [Microvirga sp.]|jgi:hypothetical protein|nr:NepR family anti-sigma factor [Microvirga sp.]